MNQDMIYKTVQDMKKDMILHTRNEGAVHLGRTRVLLRAYCCAPWGVLRTILLLLMMMVGVNGAWGQTGPVGDDLSGYYYIANYTGDNGTTMGYNEATPETNYYLCPARPADDADENYNYDAIYYDGNNKQQPYLTTYRTGRVENAIWVVEFATTISNVDYYYIKYYSDSKYLTHNTSKAAANNRFTVHLQETAGNNNESLFCFESGTDGSYFIRTQKVSSGNRHLNPATGNKNYYYGIGAGAKITKINGKNVDPGGMIGYYTHNTHSDDQASQWYLEKVKPTISYNSNSLIEITISCGENATIYYTTDGEEPPTSGTDHIYSEPFDPADNVTTIKAVAIVNNVLSDVTTLTLPVLCGNNHKYLIQSQNNVWNSTGYHFYMIPGDVDNNNFTRVNTTSLFRPSMEWHFAGAGMENGIQFYYIVNNSNSKYLCYVSSTVFMDDFIDDNKFKFKIVESPVSGTFNIIPYDLRNATGNTNRFVNKNTDNANPNPINLANDAYSENTRWKFVTKSALDQTAPFTVSDASSSSYYKIASDGYYIVPPSSGEWVTTSNSPDAKSGSWYFEVAQAATDDDWCTYYHIRNAETGDYLYFTRNVISNDACFKLNNTIPNGEEDRYMFTWARTATENTYYIIPKYLKDAKLNTISTLNRNNATLNTVSVRTAGNAAWTFTTADLFCNDPVFVEEGGVIKIKCNTNAAKIYINTESDTNPTDGSTLYDPTQVSAQNWPKNNQVRIKAIAIVSDGSNNTASSTVITLLNKPDVTLEEGPYTYKAAAWEPGVTVSIGEGGNATTAASDTYTIAYANNINAGTASVTITDADDTDNLYIWNVPVKEFTIDKKDLTITANPKTIGYGDEADNDGVTYSGFAGSETEAVLGGTLGYSYTTKGDDPQPYTPYDPSYGNVGEYDITPGGLTSTNYDITFVPGIMTVTKKSFGDGSLAEGFTLDFDESGGVILKYGTHTLTKDVDYEIGDEVSGTKYSSRTISGTGNNSGSGNYTGTLAIRNAIVHFTTDADREEWSATFVAESSGTDDIGHALPEGISAYIISNISGERAIAEPLDYIPAGVPVLLLAHEETNGFIVTDANSESVTEITDTQIGYNKLTEVTEGSTHFDTRQIYVLYNNEFVLNKAGDLAQGKVYMDNPNYISASPSPARLIIDWGNETDIKDIQKNGVVERTTDRWYTMDGRRLSGKPNANGLYILNGKKIVVK